MNDPKEHDTHESEEKQFYASPRLQRLGPVKHLTLGGSDGSSEDGSSDENESFP